MSPNDHNKSKVGSKPDVAQIQLEMETRRVHMLKMLEDSKARLKAILRDSTPPPRHDSPPTPKHKP
jgi:hypothetical protein